MTDQTSMENDFLIKITRIIEENLSDERFGVSELAHEIGMSRSNLLRKIKKSTSPGRKTRKKEPDDDLARAKGREDIEAQESDK